jgi:hypothetical protein
MLKISNKKIGERRKYLHIEIRIGILRISIFKMRTKFNFRIELSSNNW